MSTEARMSRLIERHPSPLGEAAVILGHLYRVAVLQSDLEDGLHSVLPDVDDFCVLDLARRLVTHPELHAREPFLHRDPSPVDPCRVPVPIDPADEDRRL